MVATQPTPIWKAPGRESIPTQLMQFRKQLSASDLRLAALQTYDDMHAYSITDLPGFWQAVWNYVGIRCVQEPQRIVSDPQAEPGDVPTWFDGAAFSVAENLLFPLHPDRRQNDSSNDDDGASVWPADEETALLEINEQAREQGRDAKVTTWGALRQLTFDLARSLRANGIKPDDVVGCISANNRFPLALGLAVNAVGAVYCLFATDDGPASLKSKLSQVRPALLFTPDVATWNGKEYDIGAKALELVHGLAKADQVVTKLVVMLSGLHCPSSDALQKALNTVTLHTFLNSTVPTQPYSRSAFAFTQRRANDALQIFFSSGTTGEPKCIVHGQGVLVNMKKERLLQQNTAPRESFMQITTCGWIMWLVHYSTLSVGGTPVLYEGSPLYPTPVHLLQAADRLQLNGFGISPRFLTVLQQAVAAYGGERPSFPALRQVTSSGAPLSKANVEFFYRFFPRDVRLASLSGGTDIAGQFCGPSADMDLLDSSMQRASLGIALQVWDPDTGKDITASGQAGELMVIKPFPNQPIGFFGPASKRAELARRYQESYYARFPGSKAWCQGDFISRHPTNHTLHIHGRSDGVLNPNGVRFGSAEIYNVVEKLDFVRDSIVVGQKRANIDDDERVLLFVQLDEGVTMNDQQHIRPIQGAIRNAYSARHVPHGIFQVCSIPVTLNGKKPEMAVKHIVNGTKNYKPSSSISNPEALQSFYQYAHLHPSSDYTKKGASHL